MRTLRQNLLRSFISFWIVGNTASPPNENIIGPNPRKKEPKVGFGYKASSNKSWSIKSFEKITITATTVTVTATTGASLFKDNQIVV